MGLLYTEMHGQQNIKFYIDIFALNNFCGQLPKLLVAYLFPCDTSKIKLSVWQRFRTVTMFATHFFFCKNTSRSSNSTTVAAVDKQCSDSSFISIQP